jgi:hypothetical protein
MRAHAHADCMRSYITCMHAGVGTQRMRMPRPFINLLPGGFRHPGEVACVYHNSEDKLHSRVMCREDKFQGQMNVCLTLECRDTHEHTQTHTHTHTHTHTAKLIARVTPVAVKGYICHCRRQQPSSQLTTTCPPLRCFCTQHLQISKDTKHCSTVRV